MLRRFVALLLALWFPLQALASLGMSFCAQHGPGAADGTPHSEATAADCHSAAASASGHDAHADHDSTLGAGASDPAGCDQCGLCHLACAGYLPGGAAGDAPRAAAIYAGRDPLPVRSHQPDLFDRPPLKRAA